MKPRIDLLRQLATHLKEGQLGHTNFDFRFYNKNFDFASYNVQFFGDKCGTNGCALGECPIVWPDKWGFAEDSVGIFYDSPLVHPPLLSAQYFFDIDVEQFNHLFIAGKQSFGFKNLEVTATKEEVANHIIEFCKLYE